jgi:hypothetical protein
MLHHSQQDHWRSLSLRFSTLDFPAGRSANAVTPSLRTPAGKLRNGLRLVRLWHLRQEK